MGLNTQGSDDVTAVLMRNAVKSYGKGENRVLDNLDMTVPRGCIYGLLGASGVGKTTLLSVIVGLLKLDSGEVRVLGGTPGEKGSGVPGPRIGYMPQETALVEEFTAKDAFFYFGWAYGMCKRDILERYNFLSDLLDLPPDTLLVKNFSGGQARRLSLAVSVMQNPEMLILDEPTVGQDPLLRQSIWNYMIELSDKKGMTIVLTTHYLEEAKEAHKIGLLRQGTLLAETSPNNLLAQFNCNSLEDVSLLLSQRQTDRSNHTGDPSQLQIAGPSTSLENSVVNTDGAPDPDEVVARPCVQSETKLPPTSTARSRIRAILYKDYIKLLRNIPGLIFAFGFPLLQTCCFFLAIGGDLKRLPVGVVNTELGNCYQLPGGLTDHYGAQFTANETCELKGMSCAYLDKIDTSKVVLLYFDTLEEGLEATKEGKTFSTLYFNDNFTEAMQLRQEDPQSTEDDAVNKSEIKIWMDMSDYMIGRMLQEHYLEKYIELQEYISEQCDFSKNYVSIPIKAHDPVHGSNDPNYVLTMAPGFILTMVMFAATSYSGTAILTEKTDGIWQRNLSTGVQMIEIFWSLVFNHVCVVLVITAEVSVVGFCVFNLPLLGSLAAVLLLLFLQALCGIATGLLISVVSPSLFVANVASMGIIVPYVILAGILWPFQGMPYILQIVAAILPGPEAVKAFHNILHRGWDITHSGVYPGYLILVVWTIILTCISIFRLKHS